MINNGIASIKCWEKTHARAHMHTHAHTCAHIPLSNSNSIAGEIILEIERMKWNFFQTNVM